MAAKNCVHPWKPITKEENDRINKIYKRDVHDYIRMGPKGYILPKNFLTYADDIFNLPLRSDDVFVVTYPRSGTTLTIELTWLLAHKFDFAKAKSVPLGERAPFLELNMFFMPGFGKLLNLDAEKVKEFEDANKPIPELLNKMPSQIQRVIKTHLPLSLCPTGTQDTTKIIYVARDMRDVAVSCYHFYKSNNVLGIECDFKEFYIEMFLPDFCTWSPYWEHVKEAWALRDQPNMLFIFYEELNKDLRKTCKRIADFLGKKYTEEQMDELCEHLSIDNMRKNEAVDMEELRKVGIWDEKKDNFIRKGKAGGWRDYFDDEMAQQAEALIKQHFDSIGLHFPKT